MKSIFTIARQISENVVVRTFLFFLIILSAIITGIETYPLIASSYRDVLAFIDTFIIISFTIEILLKILALEKRPLTFFSDPWNVFDFIIVAICLVPAVDTHFVAMIRIVRVLRVLRMISFFPKLRLLVGALLKSIPSMGYVILLLSMLFYVYAIIGSFIFGANDPTHFGNLHHALVTLFKVLTLEGWTDIMNLHLYGSYSSGYDTIVSIWPFVYFASFILFGAMIIMNLFIGVIMKSMEDTQSEMNDELQEMKFKGKSSEQIYLHILAKLDELKEEVQSIKNIRSKP